MASIRFRHGSRGFTLLESMVALAIVALGMMAVHTQLNRFIVSALVTEEKTLASWATEVAGIHSAIPSVQTKSPG